MRKKGRKNDKQREIEVERRTEKEKE